MKTSKKFVTVIAVFLLFIGLLSGGCAGITVTRQPTVITSSDGIKTITYPDGRKVEIDLNTDGKGGVIIIRNTGNINYWYAGPSLPNTGRNYQQITIRDISRGVALRNLVEMDGEYHVFYRERRTGDRVTVLTIPGTDGLPSVGTYEVSTNWYRKTVYVSNDQTVEVNIP